MSGGRFIVWRLSRTRSETLEVGHFNDPALALALLAQTRGKYPGLPAGVWDEESPESGNVEERLREELS